MFMNHQYLVVNGILTRPSDINNWTDVFEDLYQNEGYPCTKYEYFSGALTRWIKQGKRVKDIETIVNRINAPVVYVGHSNGCELFGRLMKDTKTHFEAAHLFAPAMDADCNQNGLTLGLLANRVNNIYLYCSKGDKILKDIARPTSFLKIIGLGYGDLGFEGPKNILPQIENRIYTTWKDSLDHSDWFKDPQLQESFSLTFNR
jgi:predicted alpha/beta hydrolase family esterase